MADDLEADDDERSVELSTIEAIYPELVVDPQNIFAASLELPVEPAHPFPVVFPPLADGAGEAPSQQQLPSPPSSHNADSEGPAATIIRPPVEIRYLSYLPSLQLKVVLPDGYPSEVAPEIQLISQLSWLPPAKLKELQDRGKALWEENGRNEVLYDYIDFLQQAAEDGFGLVTKGGSAFALEQHLEVALLDNDLQMKRRKFEQETFDCGVCLEPKKGSVCHRLQLCGHVFCVECLQDFYINCITEGDVAQVKCLAPNCEEKSPDLVRGSKRTKTRKDRTLDPSELLQIPIGQEKVQRYITMKRKQRFESKKSTIYCPRKWCQGPARTSKRRNDNDDDESDSDDDIPVKEYDPNANQDTLPPPSERLAVCEDCAFAFCLVCKISWHGEFQGCFPRSQYELTAEEKASEDYLKMHSTCCPTCDARCQKTMGCNHMICFRCKSHFCYLCSSWLSADNPYVHFNTPEQGCYQRLWELEEGEGDNARVQDRPVRQPRRELARVVLIDPILNPAREVEEQLDAPPPAPDPPAILPAGAAAAPPQQQQQQGQWQAPPGVRVNRRAQQGLVRPAAEVAHVRGDGLQRFLRMAADDMEDEWDSDDLDSDEERDGNAIGLIVID